MRGADKIDYIYFDVDNRMLVKTRKALIKIYYKGVKPVYEMVFPDYIEGQVLVAMSSTSETETGLRCILWIMWKKQHPKEWQRLIKPNNNKESS